MGKLETPMIRAYWCKIGGTLVEEFPVVPGPPTTGPRRLDAVILPKRETRKANAAEVSLQGEDIFVVQAKANRIGMYLMGQALFSAELVRRFNPASVKSVALCAKGDEVLRPLFERFPGMEVGVMPGFRAA